MLKRLLDIIVSLAALILLFPLLLLTALLVARNLGSPVLFRQERPGLNGKPFTILKFRTMKDATDSAGNSLPDSERLIPFGQKLRSTSIDELPELINVLRGDMSLVGPRPLIMAYVDRYTEHQARRMEVRPGITGWAQVNGRNSVDWDQRFEMDVWYVDNRNLWLDLRILWLTLITVFRREGVSAVGHATMPEFMGSRKPGA